MAEFATIDSNNTNKDVQVKTFYPSDGTDQSLGQLDTYKLMTGATRGDQQVKGRFVILDATNNVRMIMGYSPGSF